MVTRQLTVSGDVLRTDMAGNFVDLTSKFSSSIYLEQENKRINAKSIIGVLSMNLMDGDQVNVLVDGDDQNNAIAAVEDYLAQGA